MKTEASDIYNKNISNIVTILYTLRSIEHNSLKMSVKYKKAKLLLKDVLIMLKKTNNFILFKPMWEELHDRMAYYYDYLNDVNLNSKLPLFRMTLHNEAVNWWIKIGDKNKLKGPLIHFDTHDDMGLPSPEDKLLKKGCLDKHGIKKGSCGQICWPVSCLLLSKYINHVIWAMPKWNYEDDNEFDQTLTCSKKNVYMYKRDIHQNKDKFISDEYVKIVKNNGMKDTYKFYHPMYFNRIKVDTLTKWVKLGNKIKDNFFILDIDLDFFVSNGNKKTSISSYKKTFEDVKSTGRNSENYTMNSPRQMYSDDDSIKCIKELNKEYILIHKRVNIFLEGLLLLKKQNIKPCCINISDSTSTFFSGNTERAVFTNEYTPKYFVPCIYELLLKGFNKLYKTNY